MSVVLADLCAEEQLRTRDATGDEVDIGRQQVGVLVFVCCILTNAHCGLVVLLENRADVSGLLLFLLRVVLDQRRPLGSPAPSFLHQLARRRRRRPVCSSFAGGCPAARHPVGGTGLTGQLSTTVGAQWSQSERVGQVHVVNAVASR